MGRVFPWLAAVLVLVALLPTLCVSQEGGPTSCQSLVLLPLPWGESADTWGYAVAVAASVLTFVGLRLALPSRSVDGDDTEDTDDTEDAGNAGTDR